MDLFDQGRADYRASRQLIEERLGVLQDRCVESFGEPAVDRREKIMGFGALALITPEAGEAGGSTKLKSFRILSVRYGKTLPIILLGCGFFAYSSQQTTSPPIQLRLIPPLLTLSNDLLSFGQAIQAINGSLKFGMHLGERQQRPGH